MQRVNDWGCVAQVCLLMLEVDLGSETQWVKGMFMLKVVAFEKNLGFKGLT